MLNRRVFASSRHESPALRFALRLGRLPDTTAAAARAPATAEAADDDAEAADDACDGLAAAEGGAVRRGLGRPRLAAASNAEGFVDLV